jgi:hypothetical protein
MVTNTHTHTFNFANLNIGVRPKLTAVKRILFILLGICIISAASAQQTRKQLPAKLATTPIKIDGNLDDEAWKDAPIATDFIEHRPNPGAPEKNKSVVKILYDNQAIYIAGYMHERTPDSVSRELVGRDRIGNSDFCGVIFDSYFDKINAVGFYVTPYGEQYDAKYSNTSGEDDSWDAVWNSEAKLQPDGWTFEMEIPYSALRFTTKENQTWGLNITRRRQKTSQQFFWNHVDPNINGFINQEGEWTGIGKIKSPVRLSLSPYLSAYANHYPANTPGVKNTTTSINGGMDIKFGLSQSFTLDMTLVPDFGQVQSDNQVLNLSPFEVRYNENRPFFTEGTELFNKGNLFYSRRIGGAPIHQWDVYGELKSNERILKNPTESKLINATKISGRMKNGLGIGFLNAVTRPMYADIVDDNGNQRKYLTNPLTNYNILVFDQTLKNNSSVSIINTNVLRNGHDYDANVTAGLFDINNKQNSFNVNGKVAVSQLYNFKNGRDVIGYSHAVGFAKTSGRFNFNLVQEVADDKYNISDMGYFTNNNYVDHYLWIGYRWVKPTKWYNSIYLNNNFGYSRRMYKSSYQRFNYNVNVNGQLKNLWFLGMFAGYNAAGNDFFEPRVAKRSFRTSEAFNFNLWGETNRAKKFSFSWEYFISLREQFKGRNHEIRFGTNYRFSDKFSLGQSISVSPSKNGAGFAWINSDGDILFDRRDRRTIENTIDGKYNFNKRSGITVRIRHYWSEKETRQYYLLGPDGEMIETNKVPLRNGQRQSTDCNLLLVVS